MSKPTGSVALNTSHALYSRLKFCAPLTENTGLPKDLVSNTTASQTNSGSGITWSTNSRGEVCISNEADTTAFLHWDSLNLTGFNGNGTNTGSYTIVAIGAKPHNSGATRGLVMVGTAGGASDEFGFDALHLFKDSNGPVSSSSTTALTVDTVYDVCMSLGQSAANGGTGVTFYVNGSTDYSNTAIQTDIIPTSGTIRLLQGRDSSSPLSGTVAGLFIYSGELTSSEIATLIASPWSVVTSVTPPATLSSPTSTPSIVSATIGATTNQGTAGSNNVYGVWSTSNSFSGVTAAQVKAGQNASGSTSGVSNSGVVAVTSTSPSISVTGLTASTTYYYAIVQNNANGDSNVVTGSFTTLATASSTSVGMRDNSNASINSTSFNWFITSTWGGSVLVSGTTSTNSSGALLLNALALAPGSYLLFYKLASDETICGIYRVTTV